jgi:DNA invertase Pin-like site-specific DNA recombinase
MAQTAVTAPAFTVLDLPGGERNLIGLARVSTDAQDAQLQRDALTLAGCGRIFEEKASTRKATTDRPGLVAALDYMRAGDTLAVWKLDRLGRSVKDVLTIADDLHARGIGVRILTGKLSGSYSPAGEGKFFFTMMAAFAELERDIIHERTMAGLVAARARGRSGGRPTCDGRGQAGRRPGAPCTRREPHRDRPGARRQPGIGIPAPGRKEPGGLDQAEPAHGIAGGLRCVCPHARVRRGFAASRDRGAYPVAGSLCCCSVRPPSSPRSAPRFGPAEAGNV